MFGVSASWSSGGSTETGSQGPGEGRAHRPLTFGTGDPVSTAPSCTTVAPSRAGGQGRTAPSVGAVSAQGPSERLAGKACSHVPVAVATASPAPGCCVPR